MSTWPLNKAYIWERAPFLRLLLPLIAGICCYSFIDPTYVLPVSISLVASLLAFGVTSFINGQSNWLITTRAITMHLAIAAIGWVLCYSNDAKNKSEWYNNKPAAAYIATITKAPAAKEKTWKLEVRVTGNIANNIIAPTTGNAFVYIYKDSTKTLTLHEGDTILLPADWQPIANAGNPYEFNYLEYCARNNIYHQQFLAADKILLCNASTARLSFIQRGHNWCMQQLQNYITDKPTLGLVQAMLIGDEANLDTDLRQAYSDTGIIHIIAISGSHITFFFFILSFVLGFIRHKKYHWIKYLLAIPMIWLYVIMAGAPPSAVRAALMFTILGIGFALEQRTNTLNHLLATAFLLLCAEPMWLYAVGFQLSFLAVLSLILFYQPIYNWVKPTNIITKGIWGAVAASLAAELLVAPLVIYYFHMFPLLFIVANVAAYLFMGVVLILGMLIVAVSGIPLLAGICATVTVFLAQVFHKLVYAMQSANPISFHYLDISSIELVLLYAFIILILIAVMQERKQAFISSLIALLLFTASLCIDDYQTLQQRKLIVYNISKAIHVELISSNAYITLASADSILPKIKQYVLDPAHTGFHAWHRTLKSPALPVQYVNGHSVLVLNNPDLHSARFHVDYLVLDYPARPEEINHIKQTFSPLKLVLGNNIKRYKIPAFVAACKVQNLSLHVVSQDGAFIL